MLSTLSERIQATPLPLLLGSSLAALLSSGLLLAAIRSRKKDEGPKVVLITGCANGLGKATAEALMARGDYVIGTDVDEVGLAALSQAYPTKFKALVMNVSLPESVERASKELAEFSRKPCLDAIVNNAGVIRGGPLTELPDKDMATVLNVNVYGSFLVTKYFFPLLKRDNHAQYKPRVINFGSEVSYAGISAVFNGPYAMSKFSIEAYSASLRQELSMLQPAVYVIVMNPGAHVSGMTTANRGHNFGSAEIKAKSMFSDLLTKGEPMAQKYMDTHCKPAKNIGDRICELVHQINPPRRVKINVSLEMELMKYTPQSVLDTSVKFMFKYVL